ncbi:MAG: hypothetical protein KJZ96_08080 [Rhodocyclaceae bacterium]|jgi:hypothetical protein|nr:hypothetical protein [Rhodocyclaceae bacterium]
MRMIALAVAATTLFISACATGTGATKDPYARSGFYTHVHDGRLWVLKDGDKDIELVSKNKEPKVVVTRIAAGPNNMTVKSNNAEVIDAYLKAK